MKRLILCLLCLMFLLCGVSYASTLTLPSKLKTIYADAFYGDTSIDEVILPNGVTTIGSRAFAYSSLTKINLPSSLTSISDNAFLGVSNFTIDAKWGTTPFNWAVNKGYLQSVKTVSTGNTSVPINAANETYCKFVAPSAGTYTFQTTGSDDTYGYLYNTSKSLLAYDNDGGENYNFKITRELTSNQTVYLGVKYYSPSKSGSVTLNISKISVEPPSAPTNVTMIDNGTSITLSWSKVANATNYTVYVSSSTTNLDNATPYSAGDVDTFTFHSWSIGDYAVWVVAENSAGTSTKSEIKYRRTVYPPSTAPEITASYSESSGVITVNWSSVDGATGYIVNFAEKGDLDKKVSYEVGGDILTYRKPVWSFTSYSVWVEAKNSAGTGPSSTVKNVSTGGTIVYPPSSIPEITASYSSSTGKITVTWSTVSNATSFVVTYERNGYSQVSDEVSGSSYSFSAVSGTSYRIWVTPKNSAGEGSSSTVKTVSTESTIITAYTGNTSVSISAGEETLCKFVAPSAGTYIFQTTGSDDTKGYLYDASKNELAYNDDGGDNQNFKIEFTLTNGQTVYVGVWYYSPSKNGTETLNISKASTVPNAPTNVSASTNGTSSITVSWTKSTSSNVTGYAVYYGTSSSSSSAFKYDDYSSSATSAMLSGLNSDTKYYVWVKAKSSAGDSSFSSSDYAWTDEEIGTPEYIELKTCAFTASEIRSTTQNDYEYDQTGYPLDAGITLSIPFSTGKNVKRVTCTLSYKNSEGKWAVYGDLEEKKHYSSGSSGHSGEFSMSLPSDMSSGTYLLRMYAKNQDIDGDADFIYLKVKLRVNGNTPTPEIGHPEYIQLEGCEYTPNAIRSTSLSNYIHDMTGYPLDAGETWSIPFTAGRYVSKVLYTISYRNDNDQWVQYGNLKGEMNSTSGTFYFTLPSDMRSGKYLLRLFAENQDGSDYIQLCVKIKVKGQKSQYTFDYPLSSYYVTSGFGERNGSQHTGIDLRASIGTNVYASAEGTISEIHDNGCLGSHNSGQPNPCSLGTNCQAVKKHGSTGSYGNWIVVDHGNNQKTLYAHLTTGFGSEWTVGEKVYQGEYLAKSGAAGNTYGAHLHFEIRINGSPVNPVNYLRK